MNKTVDKVTRDVLRGMEQGDSVTFSSENGYAIESARSLAYTFQRLEKVRFTCKIDGQVLIITKVS